MSDYFENHQPGLESPPSGLTVITPDDATDLPWATRALNVTTSGLVYVTTVNGDSGDIYVAAGSVFPIRATRVWDTGTTATGIRGLV